MKVLKILALALTALVIIFVTVPVLLPESFNVKRQTIINAKPEVVYGEVNSYQKWEAWSPWLERDSTIINTYSGPASGVGNKVTWTSKESGAGSMEMIEDKPGAYINTKLVLDDFNAFESHFTFEEVTEGTRTTWADSGSMGYLGRWMNLFADKMMGPDFEKGLANLKKHVEALPAPTPEPIVVDSTIVAK